MTIATVELSRKDGNHIMSIKSPNGQLFHLNLDGVTGAVVLIQWADYHLNRPATPVEELVDEFERAVYDDTVNRSVYAPSSGFEAEKAKLLAAIAQLTKPQQAAIEHTVKAVLADAANDLALESSAPPGLRSPAADVLKPHVDKILGVVSAHLWAKDQRIAELRKGQDAAQAEALKWETRCKDDQGLWLATRDANIRLGAEIAELKKPCEDYRKMVTHCLNQGINEFLQTDAPPGAPIRPDLSEPTDMLLAAFGRLKAERDHWKANHDEMVARNKVFRDRPEIQGDVMHKLQRAKELMKCGHPKHCVGRVNEHDRTEPLHCLWCGDITDMSMLIRHLTATYSSFTDGRITKPNTLPEEVIAVAGDLETERTEAAVKDALAEAGSDDSYRNKLYEELREIVPYTGHFEPGASVTIHWKAIPGEVDGPTVDHGYVFVYPNEDADVGACVHIPHPDPRGDRDVSPEWPTVAELLANILIERIDFTERVTPDGARETADGASRLVTVDERFEREVKLLQHLNLLGVIRIERGLLATEIKLAYKAMGNAA